MDPYSGDVFALREELIGAETAFGDLIDAAALRAKVDGLSDASDDERAAAERERLTLVSGQVAQRLKLGNREQRRRRQRRRR